MLVVLQNFSHEASKQDLQDLLMESSIPHTCWQNNQKHDSPPFSGRGWQFMNSHSLRIMLELTGCVCLCKTSVCFYYLLKQNVR